LASAVNTNSKDGTPAAGPRPAFSGTPVAQETPVTATGARPGESSEKRELFTEATTTALVFPNGGVIRLSVAVTPGQLLFLTNQQSRREVVTQVIRRRNNPSAGYYVELEFTEASPGFWGVEFPDVPEAIPVTPQQSSAAEIMQSAPAADEPDEETQAPSAAEVEALMEEVEALRAQLRSMQTPAPATAATHTPPAAVTAPGQAAAAPELAAPHPSVLTPPAANHQASEAAEHDHTEPSPANNSAPENKIGESIPEKALEADDQDLLPKPALDFKKAKAPKQAVAMNAPPAPADSSGLLRLLLLAAVSLFAVSVAAWQLHWLPWSSPNNASDGVAAPGRPLAKPAGRPAAQPKSGASANPAAATSAANTSTQPGTGSATVQPNASGSDAAPSTSAEPPTASPDTSANATPKDEPAPVTPVAKRSTIRSSAAPESSPVIDGNAAIVPPKLIKSVRAVAPGDALRQFVTGNVTLDALIDKNGEVKSMKVLSGPASFHKAAMDALKQYRYEPARQNGKPVSAHVTVTVPFWFEP
jgi:TonB family protein